MDEATARLRLKHCIQPDNRLYNLGAYISWNLGEQFITLDGDYFDAEELEAIAWWMQNASDLPRVELGELVMKTEVPDTYLKYLDELRASGRTNMFGAAEYLQQRFELSRSEARDVLAHWMETFETRHPEAS